MTVYIAGFLNRNISAMRRQKKYHPFLDKLDRGKISITTLASVNFVNCVIFLHHGLPEPRKGNTSFDYCLLLTVQLQRLCYYYRILHSQWDVYRTVMIKKGKWDVLGGKRNSSQRKYKSFAKHLVKY